MAISDCNVVLASTSPRRFDLLQSLGIRFQVLAPAVGEEYTGRPQPAELVESLALRKATAVAAQLGSEHQRETLVIGADTVVVRDAEILGKPKDPSEALAMLCSLAGREHEVYSGLAVVKRLPPGGGAAEERKVGHSLTKVRMRSMSRDEAAAYVATGEPMDKAGSYAIQGLGATLVEAIVGDYSTVVGLPIPLLGRFLREWGLPLF